MRVVVDNNVVIDALKPNPQFEAEAQEILRLASKNEIDGLISANSLTDIFYVLRKIHGVAIAKEMVRKLLLILDVIGIEPADCAIAIEKPMDDFEDALIEACAKRVGADCVVSRDAAFAKAATDVALLTPSQLLVRIKT